MARKKETFSGAMILKSKPYNYINEDLRKKVEDAEKECIKILARIKKD